MRAREVLRSACAIALVAAFMSAPASAEVVTPSSIERAVIRRDGNDTPSPLDLRRVKLVHVTHAVDMVYLTAWNAVTNLQLEPTHHGNFGVLIDTNDRPRRFEYAVYLFSTRTGIHGAVYNLRRKSLVPVQAARLGPRSFRVSLPLSRIGNPDSYRFLAFGYYLAAPCAAHPCNDYAPNASPLPVQDLSPPDVASGSRLLLVSSVFGSGPSVPLPFKVTDDRFGSGVGNWRVVERAAGDVNWSTVASGASGSATVQIPGAAGTTYAVRVLARDRAGNLGELDRTVVFPFDDQNTSAVGYTAGWTNGTGSATSYLGTTSSSSMSGANATFTFQGGWEACLLGMPTPGEERATVTVDSSPVPPLLEDPDTTPRGGFGCWYLDGGDTQQHTVTVTVGTAPDGFVIDGLAVVLL